MCAHYRTIEGDIVRISGYSIIVGTGWSYLYPISESKYRCRVCKMEFTIEQYHAMQAFIASYPSQECKTLDSAHAEIQKIVPPVGYYELGEDSVKTVPLAEGEVVIPRIVLSSDGLRYYMESENLKSKNLRVEKRVVEGPC